MKTLVFAGFAWIALFGGARGAGIEIEESYQPYEPIVARVLDEAHVYFWDLDRDGLESIEIGNGEEVHLWARPGRYVIRCLLLTIDWEKHAVSKTALRAEFTVESPDPEPDQNPYAPPAAEFRPLAVPLTKFQLSRIDATMLAVMYARAGESVSAGVVTGSAELRQSLIDEGKPLGLKGKYPGLAEAVEKAVVGGLTLENRQLDPVRTAAFLRTLAWALWDAGKQEADVDDE